MTYVNAAIAVLFLLALLNLLLTLGIIRRLREYAEVMSTTTTRGPSDLLLAAGDVPGEFSALTIDGETVSLSSLNDGSVVAFLAPHCHPCTEMVPALVERLAGLAGGRPAALTVVLGDQEESAELVARLQPVARVVVEPRRGPVANAFRVRSSPVLYMLGAQGRVTAAGHHLGQLPLPTTAVT